GSVAVFNDAIRDGLKGSVFNQTEKGYISGAANKSTAARVVFGITGGTGTGAGWKAVDAMVVNYMTSHDNHTLWDKLLLSNPGASDEARVQMVKFGASIVMISKGMPFFLAGEEMLRSKQGDGNSYRSSDEINNIDWETLREGSAEKETAAFYAGLIRMRKENGFLTGRFVTPECEVLQDMGIHVRYLLGEKVLGEAWINPNPAPLQACVDTGAGEARVLLYNGGFPEDQTVRDGDKIMLSPKTVLLIAAEYAD
nr:hypothetical protein [Clostridiales bacterium]